jgi:phage shock protein PspC (stress-responsive transcriptional regulator)
MGRLLRSEKKKIAGVAAGIADNYGWKVRNVRLIWVLLSVLLLGSPVLFYLVLWAVMPARAKEKKSYEERMRDKLGK